MTVTLDGVQRSGLKFRPDTTPLSELVPLMKALSELDRGWERPTGAGSEPLVTLESVKEGSLQLTLNIAACGAVLIANLHDSLTSGAQARWPGVSKCVAEVTALAGNHPRSTVKIREERDGVAPRETEVRRPTFIPTYDFKGPATIVGEVNLVRSYRGAKKGEGSFEVDTEAWGTVRVHAPSRFLPDVRVMSQIVLEGEGTWDAESGNLVKLRVSADQLKAAISNNGRPTLTKVLDDIHASDRSHWDDVDVEGWIKYLRG